MQIGVPTESKDSDPGQVTVVGGGTVGAIAFLLLRSR